MFARFFGAFSAFGIGIAVALLRSNPANAENSWENVMSSSNFKVNLFQTNASNAASGGGSLSLTGSGTSYTGKATFDVDGVGKITENVTGSSASSGGQTFVNLRSPSLQLTLLQNPFESRLSYGGCASVNGGYIYNVTAVA
jgi:hypothetical protein